MNILLSGSCETAVKTAKDLGWEHYNRSTSGFIDLEGEQVLNVSDHRDLVGKTIDKIYIHHSFFSRRDVNDIVFELSFRCRGFDAMKSVNLQANFQCLEKPKELTKWEKIKAFFSGEFKIQWT